MTIYFCHGRSPTMGGALARVEQLTRYALGSVGGAEVMAENAMAGAGIKL